MKQTYNIYCDESCHLPNDGKKSMAIGAVWCPEEKKDLIFRRLREIKVEHGLSKDFELKWNKVSPAKYAYYLDILNYFFDNSDLHFRVLVVPDKTKLNHEKYNQTHDEFYYKMYFEMLKIILKPDETYNIYIDIKDTKGQNKVDKLHEYLCNSKYDFRKENIRRVQQIRSHEVELVPLADFLIGAISYVWQGLSSSDAKLKLIKKIKERSGYSLIQNTLPSESKFNVFIWEADYVH